MRPKQASAFVLVLAVVLLSWPRLAALTQGLPDYAIDENDVVETAVAMIRDAPEYYIHHYGPLLMYLVAGVLALWGAVVHGSVDEFASQVFFAPTTHYVLARLVCALIVVACAGVCYRFAARNFGRRAAVYAALLAAMPLMEALTDFNVRVDVLQALMQAIALFAAAELARHGAMRSAVVCGVATGLCLAAKGLPGLIGLPVGLAAVAMAPAAAGAASSMGLVARLRHLATDRRSYAYMATAAVAFLATNPIAWLDASRFLDTQIWIVRFQEQTAYPSGAELLFGRYLDWGVVAFALLALATVVQLAAGDKQRRLLAAFVLVYVAAFMFRPSRQYFYCAIVPPLCVLLGDLLARSQIWLAARVRRGAWALPVAALVAVALSLPPNRAVVSPPPTCDKRSNPYAAARWVEANLQPGAKLLVIGVHAYGLKLLADRIGTQAGMGEYFMYGRDRSAYLRSLFRRGYAAERATGRPAFAIAMQRNFGDYARLPHDDIVRDVLPEADAVVIGAAGEHRLASLPWRSRLRELHRSDRCPGEPTVVYAVDGRDPSGSKEVARGPVPRG